MMVPKATLLSVLAVIGASAAHADPPAAKHETRPPLLRPEHARLTAMVGTWDVEMTFWFQPGRPGVTTKATSTVRPLFDGLFVEERIEGTLNGSPFTTLSWTGYNPTTQQYEATRIATTNPARIAEAGSYDPKTQPFELKAEYPLAGDTWHQRTVIEAASTSRMTATSYLSFGKVPEWKAVALTYTRRSE